MIKKHQDLIFKICLALLALLGFSFPIHMQIAGNTGTQTSSDGRASEFRGIWVASVLNLDYPSQPGLSVDVLKAEAIAILDQAQSIGFNAVILQVRPTSDALYISDFFPWSAYLTGNQDSAPGPDFDPLAFWIEEAHQRNLELHAWINPYRITRDGDPRQPAQLSDLSNKNPAIQHPDWRVLHTDGNYYFDPGLPAVRAYIIQGVTEIITRYDVDGIHFDDYFYPDSTFNDEVSYANLGAGQDKDEWRRANVNQLVQSTYQAIKTLKPSVRFGISPAGIWQNSSSSPLGSQTAGYETYSNHYADCITWIENHWIDYICPQIYWEIGFPDANYSVLLEWWTKAVSNSSVDLYTGQAAYRTFTGKTIEDPWYGTGEIVRQLTLNSSYSEVKGHIMFRYGSFSANPILAPIIRDYYLYQDNKTVANSQTVVFSPIVPELIIGRPTAQNITTNQDKYCILGTSVPTLPLKVNGEEITNRTEDGYFSHYVSLSPGSNSFVFTQDGQKTAACLITYKPSDPSGSGTSGTPAIIPAPPGQSSLAQVSTANAYIFPNPTTTGGPCGDLMLGQTDRIIAATGDNKWTQLGIGVWIQSSDIQRIDNQPFSNTITAPQYTTGDKWDIISYTMTSPAVGTLTFDGRQLSLKLRGENGGNPLTLPESAPFEQVDILSANDSDATNTTSYIFTLKTNQRIEGYYTEISGNTLLLYIKKRLHTSDTTLPLENITILLDPGHGGLESGALGPLGSLLPEKSINLSTALKVKSELEKLGASVEMTRSGDDEVSLNDRVEKSRALRPDLFLSIHANSLDEASDGARVIGVSTWFKERISQEFCTFLLDFVWNDLVRPQTGWHQTNFYVCRPTWTPSIIIETGFMCNPKEFSWLVNTLEQDRLANSIARGIAAYYSAP